MADNDLYVSYYLLPNAYALTETVSAIFPSFICACFCAKTNPKYPIINTKYLENTLKYQSLSFPRALIACTVHSKSSNAYTDCRP